MTGVPGGLEDDVLERCELQLAGCVGRVHERFGLRRIERGIADQRAFYVVHAHTSHGLVVDARDPLRVREERITVGLSRGDVVVTPGGRLGDGRKRVLVACRCEPDDGRRGDCSQDDHSCDREPCA